MSYPAWSEWKGIFPSGESLCSKVRSFLLASHLVIIIFVGFLCDPSRFRVGCLFSLYSTGMSCTGSVNAGVDWKENRIPHAAPTRRCWCPLRFPCPAIIAISDSAFYSKESEHLFVDTFCCLICSPIVFSFCWSIVSLVKMRLWTCRLKRRMTITASLLGTFVSAPRRKELHSVWETVSLRCNGDFPRPSR